MGDCEAVIASSFQRVQRSVVDHQKLLNAVSNAISSDFDSSSEVLLGIINIVISVEKGSSSAINRVFNFIALLVNDAIKTSAILPSLILAHLADASKSHNRNVRYQSCRLIARIINNLDEQAEISDDVMESIVTALRLRVKDKIPSVRGQAVQAMKRLQNPDDPEDDIATDIIRLMTLDTSKEVRLAALGIIRPGVATLPAILKRTRDISSRIRELAYEAIGNRVSMRSLPVEMRIRLVMEGLRDRDPSVADCTRRMVVEHWFAAFKADRVTEFMGSFVEKGEHGVSSAEENSLRTILFHLFDSGFRPSFQIEEDSGVIDLVASITAVDEVELDDSRDVVGIDWKKAVLYSSYFQWLKQHHHEDLIDEAIPSLTELLDMAALNLKDMFVTKCILMILQCCDLADEAGRRRLAAFLTQVLSFDYQHSSAIRDDLQNPFVSPEQQNKDIYEVCLDILTSLYPNEKESSIIVVELISERVDAIKDATGTDTISGNWLSILRLVITFMKRVPSSVSNPLISGLPESTLFPALRFPDSSLVRAGAVYAIGILCLLDAKLAARYFPIVMQVIKVDCEDVQKEALKTFFDILMVFGKDILVDKSQPVVEEVKEMERVKDDKDSDSDEDAEKDEDTPMNASESFYSLCDMISQFLFHPSLELRSLATEGFSKLVFNNIAESKKILSSLIIMYFNPQTSADSVARQSLAVFFPAFAASGIDTHNQLLSVFLSTLKLLIRAPTDSPLSKVNLVNAMSFFLQLLSFQSLHEKVRSKIEPPLPSFHLRMAEALCYAALTARDIREKKLYVKFLGMIKLDEMHKGLFVLRELCVMLSSSLSDATSKRSLTKFGQMLQVNIDSQTCDTEELNENQKLVIRQNVSNLQALHHHKDE